MSQTLYYGVAVTFIVFLIAILSLFIALKNYRPDLKMMNYFSLSIVMIGIMGLAGMQVLSDNKHAKVPDDPAVTLYKNADWILSEDAGLSQLSMKHNWEENPTLENKFLYALSLLKNNDTNRAKKLLEEVNRSVDNSEYVTPTMVKDALSFTDTIPPNTDDSSNELAEHELEPIHDILNGIKDSVVKHSSFKESELELLAAIDVERLTFLASTNGDISEAQQHLNEVLSQDGKPIRNPVMKKEIAKSSMFLQNKSAAEKYFIEVIQDYPNDQESIAMLSEIYLNGDYIPSEAAQQLPQYNFAKLGAIQRAIDTYENMQIEDMEEKNIDFNYTEQLSNELAYALVDSIRGQAEDNPTIDVRLSRYYFNKGDNEKAKEFIQKMLDHKNELGVYEQMVINTIQYNDEKAKDITSNMSFIERRQFMEETYQMKEDLYASFHSPTIYPERTVSEESYEYFLTETIKEPNNETISIMNIEPDDDGEITLYLGTDNLDDLSNGKLVVTDNGKPIENFSLEKLSDLDASGSLRSIGLVLDVSGSMQGNRIELAKSASARFLQQIRDYEQAELVSFNSAPSLVQSFTKDRGSLVSSVLDLSADGGTNITDALIFELERLKNEDGHKVLFIFSDGEDDVFSEVESRAKVIDLANRYGVTIFAVGFGAGYETLSEVATETGGAYIATPNEATIFSSFDSISEMLENVYRVTYQLDPVEYGTHLVKVQYGQASDKKEYELAIPAQGPGDKASNDVSGFQIYQMNPSTIYQSKGKTKATLSGKGLKDVEILTINGEEVEDYKIVSDEEIEITIPESISYGLHLVVAVNNKGEEAQTEFAVAKPGLQDPIQFGWATLYADHCKEQGNTINCIGNPSVDKFIYPSGAKMTLENGEKLTFNGIAFAVEDTKLSFFKNTLGGQNEVLSGEFILTKEDYGEFFSLDSGLASKIKFNKLGFDIALADMKYQAKRDERPGTFTAEARYDGTGDRFLYDHTNLLTEVKLLQKIAPLLDTSVKVKAEVATDRANISGSLDYNGLETGVIALTEIGGGFQYDDIRKRVVIDARVGGFEIANRKLKGVFEGASVSLGVEYPFKPRIGVTLEGNFPLGTTGVTINKAGLLADFTSYREAGFDLGVGTVADSIVQMIVQELNKIEVLGIQLFDLNEDTQLLGLDISGQLKNAFTKDWEGTGSGTVLVLGFDVIESNGRYTSHLIEGELKKGTKTNKTTVVFSDPSYNDRLVIYHERDLVNLGENVPLNAKVSFELIPADLTKSNIKLSGKVGWKEFEYDQDDLNIFK
ncbi:VWA domain-containing protein [Gracilibacillus dipsosauri]|uniref:VWA domain-containing protein n=1 Tax=Gracilibacillus dipsosauri TaxID=178340 RepID=UPI00240A8FDC